MIVSSQLFEDYIECATKCWLRSRAEPAAGNVYAEWARAQNEAYRQDALKKLLAVLPEGDRVIRPPISKSSKDATWRIAIDVRLRTNELESRLHAVEQTHKTAKAPGRVRHARVIRSGRTGCNSRQDHAWRQPRHAKGEDIRLRQ